MDHTAFLASLDSETRHRLTARRRGQGLVHLSLHLGALGLTGAAIALGVPGWPLFLLPHGVLLVFLFTLQHECTHRTPFASDRLCDLVGHGIGALLLNPFVWFRYFHLAHHRSTNVAGDPELDSPKPATRTALVWHLTGLPLWWGSLSLILRLALDRERPAYLPERARPRAVREARVLIFLYALVAISLIWTPIALWLWVLPVLLGQPFLRLYLLAEHGDCPQVADMFANTRTTLTTALVRFLAWNMPYHVEHHVYPSVPFDRLPDLHARIRNHLQVTAQGYGAFAREFLERRR